MSRCVYDKASITLVDDTYSYICDTIQSITEYDHEIEFETVIPIDGVKRGWVGSLYYHMRGVHIEDENVKATSVTCLNDVLCTRVKVFVEEGSPVVWTYCFSKD